LLSRVTAFLFLSVTALVVLCARASATTQVTGNVKNLGTSPVSAGTFVRFYLRGCSGNLPRVNGSGIVAPTLGNVYYFDFVPDSTGLIQGTLYSTRDGTGLGPGEIECGGSMTAVWYGMQPYFYGKAGPETAIHALNGVALDVAKVAPITSNPVVTASVGLTALKLPGSISGFTLVQAEPQASGVLTLPAATDTLIGLMTTDTLFNKTLLADQLSGTTINNIMLASSPGSVGSPIYAFNSFSQGPNSGFYSPGTNQITAAVGGVNGPTFSPSGISFGNDGEFIAFGAGRDTSLSRLSAGALAVGNANQGDTSGSLNLSRVLAGNGSAATPAYSFLNQPGSGIYRDTSTGHLTFTLSGAKFAALGNGWVVPSSSVYDWSSVADPNATVDTGFSRASAGVVAVGNGTPGNTSGTLKAAIVNATSGFQVNGAPLAAANLSNGVTGSGAIVLQASPVLTTPNIGNATGTSFSILGTGAVSVSQSGAGVSMAGGNPAIVFTAGTGTATLAGGPVIGGATTITMQSGVNDTIVNRTSTDTLTNKRVTPRVVSLSSSSSLTMSTDNADVNTQVNAQAAGPLIMNVPSGTPTDGQRLTFYIKSTNGQQSYQWNSIFRGSLTTPLPSITTVGRTDYIGFIFNAADNKWDCIATDSGH
jgi:hypothetical protein